MAELLGQKQNPQATQALEQRVRELSTLHDIARAVISVLDLQSVLNRIVDAAVYLTGGEEGFLLLIDEESGDLILRAGKGLGDKAAKVMRMKVTDTLAGQVIQSGQPMRVGGFQKNKQYKVKTGYLVQSLVNVPIKSRTHGVIGVLSVDHSIESMRTFSDHDVALLSSLADYAAIAIENAQLYERAMQRAEQLAQSLEEAGSVPNIPSAAADREALEKFIQGLRAQHNEVITVQSRARTMARELRSQARLAEEMSQRLALWDEEVDNLLPSLDWLSQTGLSLIEGSRQPVDRATPSGEHPAALVLGRQLMDHLSEGILLCDSRGRILEANPAAAFLLDRQLEKIVGLELQELAVKDARWERMVGSLRLALALGDSGQPTPPSPSATLYYNGRALQATLVPMLEDGGRRPAGIVAILRDVSSEIEGWRARDETINELSERLRSPMTAIASYSDLLLSESVGLLGGTQRRYLQRIRHSTERLSTILAEVSEMISQRILHAEPEALSLNDALEEAIAAAREELSLSGVAIKAEIARDLPPVQIGAEHITKIVSELLSIAGQRTAVGEAVLLSTELQHVNGRLSHLVLSIQDGGSQSLGRAPLDRDEKVKEIKRMAEEQGGRLWIERDSSGTGRISFLVPVADHSLV